MTFWVTIIAAAGIGLLPCLFALLVRRELRLRRLKSLLEVYRQFEESGSPDGPPQAGSDESNEEQSRQAEDNGTQTKSPHHDSRDDDNYLNPLIEYVRSKYTADLPTLSDSDENDENVSSQAGGPRRVSRVNPRKELDGHIKNASKWRSFWNGSIFLGVLLFGFSSSIGFYGFLNSLLSNFKTVFPSCVSLCKDIDSGHQILVVGSIVFVGGYIAAMRLMIQAVTSFDLTGYTFVRQGGEVLFSVLLGMLIYAAFPDPMQSFGKVMLTNDVVADLALVERQKRAAAEELFSAKCQGNNSLTEQSGNQGDATQQPNCERLQEQINGTQKKTIPWYWFVLAVVFGLVPTSSTRYLLKKAQDVFRWSKTTDERFAEITRVTPLDILDGIDFETRYRLEECGLRDVQNLACANPIMLAVESPFNINELIDWIGQAQLCHIVGVERYMLLREYNVRTIFDLERAIDSKESPDTFDIIYGSILLSPTEAMKSAAEKTGIKFLIHDGSTVKHVGLEEFTSWAYGKIVNTSSSGEDLIGPPSAGASNPKSGMSQAVEHMMFWISDDLHVRRLRRLWIDIERALKEDSAYFSDSRRRKEERKRAREATS
jgi:hypothetical protein